MLKKAVISLSIEFGPIIAFFAASELMPFVPATAVFVGLTVAALIAGYIERREIAWFPVIVGVSVVGFGALTVALDDPFYIIFKDTIYNGAFAIVLAAGLALGKGGLLKPLFKGLFSMSDRGWRVLSIRWAVMFALLAVSNELARALLDEAGWIRYKALATVATVAFSLYQFRLSRRERLPDANSWGMRIHGKLAPEAVTASRDREPLSRE